LIAGKPALKNFTQTRKEKLLMAERKRKREMHFYVTDEERNLIRRKMLLSKTRNMGAYLRKMAIDGYIVNVDTTPMKQIYNEMHKISIY
jgi:hypothetical protein